jgi:L-fuconolactonase
VRELIDTHFHIWRQEQVQRKGILAAPYLRGDVSWTDFTAAWDGLPVTSCVNVQVNDFTDGTVEARWVATAADPGRLGAIVAWARLEDPAVEAELARLREIPAVRAVRRTCQYEADPAFCARPEYVRGVRLLGRMGLACDLCVRLGQIAAVPQLARACPETTIVLEHLGKPDLSHPPDTAWLTAVDRLGQLPNVVGKLSVVVHASEDPPLDLERVAPYLQHLHACLGPSRLMFGSNWPVSTAVIAYRPWVELLQELVGDDEEIWAATARRIYGLG